MAAELYLCAGLLNALAANKYRLLSRKNQPIIETPFQVKNNDNVNGFEFYHRNSLHLPRFVCSLRQQARRSDSLITSGMNVVWQNPVRYSVNRYCIHHLLFIA
jgi:hypothetical protein